MCVCEGRGPGWSWQGSVQGVCAWGCCRHGCRRQEGPGSRPALEADEAERSGLWRAQQSCPATPLAEAAASLRACRRTGRSSRPAAQATRSGQGGLAASENRTGNIPQGASKKAAPILFLRAHRQRGRRSRGWAAAEPPPWYAARRGRATCERLPPSSPLPRPMREAGWQGGCGAVARVVLWLLSDPIMATRGHSW